MVIRRIRHHIEAHNWFAVSIDLAIVIVGVLIALALQQWADNRNLRETARATQLALRDELSVHYRNAVEYRVAYPCLQAQLDRLRERVMRSGSTIEPAPIHSDMTNNFVFRLPSKAFPTQIWQTAVADGVIRHLEPQLRSDLAVHYAQIAQIQEMTKANDDIEKSLVVLARPLPLDAAVRYSIIRDIEQLSGRLRYLDLLYGLAIDHVQKVGMVPSAGEARAMTERYGTYQYCKSQGLPMRSFERAMQAVPN